MPKLFRAGSPHIPVVVTVNICGSLFTLCNNPTYSRKRRKCDHSKRRSDSYDGVNINLFFALRGC